MRVRITILAVGFASLVAFGGCRDETAVDETDRAEIFRVFRTGVEHSTDPYVRAETLRTLELLKDPALLEFARPLKDDPSAMVRVAALRVLLRAGDKDVRATTLSSFNRAKSGERTAILAAALEYGSPPLRREIVARALRGDDPTIRRVAFEHGHLTRVRKAMEEGNTEYLERTLFPELAQYVDRNDQMLGALALRTFLDAGQTERIDPLVRTFQRTDLPNEERLKAAGTLAGAHAKAAEPVFLSLVESYDESLEDDSLGVPTKVVAPELVRAAVIGAVACGNTELVPRAKAYMNQSSKEERLEVLEALAENASPEAEVALRVAMQDALEDVRARAIELYQERSDADPKALVKAMERTTYATQRRIALVLMSRYKDTWLDEIRVRLQRPSEVLPTMQLLRDVILSRSEASMILIPIKPELQEILTKEKNEKAKVAAYLLAIASDPRGEGEVNELDAQFDDEMRYAYLEYLVRETPEAGVRLFRKYMTSDLYSLRLMSASGLWRVSAAQSPQVESEGEGDTSTDS